MMVYGFNYDGRHRVIVKARSRAAVRRAMAALGRDVSDGRLREYGSETGNEREIAAANEAGEGVVLYASTSERPAEYRPMPRSGERL